MNIPQRTNNPGDLRGKDGNFRQFSGGAEGYAALLNDLHAKITGNSSTGLNGESSLYEFSHVYAPKGDKNDPLQYTVNLANQLKVKPDTKLKDLQSRIGDFANAVSGSEGYIPMKTSEPNMPSYFNDKQGKAPKGGIVPEKTPSVANLALQGIGQAAKENLVDPFTSRLNKIDYGNQNFLSNGLQTTAAAINGAYDVLGKGVNQAVDNTTKGIDATFGTNTNKTINDIEQKVGSKLSEGLKSAIAALPQDKVQQFTDFIDKHPEISKDIGSILTIFTEGKIGQLGEVGSTLFKGVKATVQGTKTTAGVIKTGIKTASDVASPYVKKGVEVIGKQVEKQAPTLTKIAKSTANIIPEKLQVARANAVKGLENKYEELFTGQSPSKQLKYKKAQDVTNAKNKAGTEGLAPQRILAEKGIIPKQGDGKLTTLDQADKLRSDTKPLHEINTRALKEVEKSVPKTKVDDVEKRAIENVRSNTSISSADQNTLEEKIRKEFEAVRNDKRYGSEIGVTSMDEIKGQQWGKTEFDMAVPQLQRDVHYAIAKAYQKTIEETAKKAGFNDVAQLNRYIGDTLEAAKSLEGLNGKVLKGGRLSKYVYTALGASAGHTLLGKIIGGIGGNAIAEVLISNSVAGPVKRALLKDLQKTQPEAYKRAIQWLKDKQLEQGSRLALPAPKSMIVPNRGGTPNPIGRPYTPKEMGDVGGVRQRLSK